MMRKKEIIKYLKDKQIQAVKMYQLHKILPDCSYYMGCSDTIGEILEYIEENKKGNKNEKEN